MEYGTAPRERQLPRHEFEDYVAQYSTVDIAKYEIAPSTEKPGLLEYWPTRKAFDVGLKKREHAKPGKVLRRILPGISDQDLNHLIDHFRETYCGSDLTLKTGSSAEDFEHAYAHSQAPMMNPHTTSYRKSLADSCMRYEFDHLPMHPVRMYDTGDFEMVWVEDENGLIAARCVVCTKTNGAAPIYGVSEAAMDVIQHYLTDRSINTGSDSDWVGARLRRYCKHHQFLAPYLDLEPRSFADQGDYLKITYAGEISGSGYQGWQDVHHQCSSCEDGCSDDIEIDGYIYCEDCCFYCDYYEMYVAGSDYTWVNQRNYFGTSDQRWSREAVEGAATFVERTNNYWRTEDTLPLSGTNERVPTHWQEYSDYRLSEDGQSIEEVEEDAA